MTTLSVSVQLDYAMREAGTVLLQVGAADTAGQTVLDARLQIAPRPHCRTVAAHGGLGERSWFQADDRFVVTYDATVRVERAPCLLAELAADPLASLPAETIEYLLPSRYCPVDTMHSVAAEMFGDLAGGNAVAAVAEWISTHLAYVPGASHGGTTALDTFHARAGVCRDYAHLLIAVVRGLGIPARMASAYAPGVTPQDFHAVAQVWLAGAWHIVDATGMAAPGDTAIIGVGRDAADIAFLTIFGTATMNAQNVDVRVAEPA